MQSPPQPNDTASYRGKSISRPSPRPLSQARGVQEAGRGREGQASSNYQIKVYCNSLPLFLGATLAVLLNASPNHPGWSRGHGAKIETRLMVGRLSKPVAQTERHVPHLEHLKLVSAQMEKTTVMQEK